MKKISTYTARHSYATVLKRSEANLAYISESLGHNNLNQEDAKFMLVACRAFNNYL